MAQIDTASSVYETSKSAIKKAYNQLQSSAESPYFGQEDVATRAVEHQTSRIPSLIFLGLALGAMGISASLAASKKRKGVANFFGLWVAPLMIMGLYNKIVKTHGSDAEHRAKHVH